MAGQDNFAVDREAAEMSLRISPEIRHSARANRQFLVRAVKFLRDIGIRQFLDVGTGLPTSPNTYEVAQAGNPDARVVYVDNDPVVILHAESLTADNQTTTVVRADLRNVEEVLAATGKLLDFTRPVGLLFLACLHNIPDHDDPDGIVARCSMVRSWSIPGWCSSLTGAPTAASRTTTRTRSGVIAASPDARA